jgi:hypothetical protein
MIRAQRRSCFRGQAPVQLTLQGTDVTSNSLTGSPGFTVRGGGLYTKSPATVTLRNSLIAYNVPDQCSGC